MGHAPLFCSPLQSAWGPGKEPLDSEPLTPGLLAPGVGGCWYSFCLWPIVWPPGHKGVVNNLRSWEAGSRKLCSVELLNPSRAGGWFLSVVEEVLGMGGGGTGLKKCDLSSTLALLLLEAGARWTHRKKQKPN